MIAISSDDPIPAAVRKRFESTDMLEDAISEIVHMMPFYEFSTISEDLTNEDALGSRLRELEILRRKHYLFSELGLLLEGLLGYDRRGKVIYPSFEGDVF